MNSVVNNIVERGKGSTASRTQNVLIILGIVSSILYLVIDSLASVIWQDYSPISQTVSEYIAIDAPTRPLVTILFIVYDLLIFAFGIGVIRAAAGKTSLKIAGGLIIAKEVLGLAATIFFPIHLRGVQADFSDTMHGTLTAAGVFLCMFPAMIAGAIACPGRFRIYSIITMILFVIFGVLAGSDQPKYTANLSTPLMGVWERLNIYGYMIWIVVLSIMLLRQQRLRAQV